MQISVDKVEEKCGPLIVYWHYFLLKWNQYLQNKNKINRACKIVSQLDIFTILTLNSVTGCSDV